MTTATTAIKEWPIMFLAPDIRSILRGETTQTRRIMFKGDPDPDSHNPWFVNGTHWQDGDNLLRCPYGKIGDRLWVKESFITGYHVDDSGYLVMTDENGDDIDETTWYQADNADMQWWDNDEKVPTPWKSSRYMPRWASRIDLEITNIQAHRIQSIRHRDALWEGWPGRHDLLDPSDTDSQYAGCTKGTWIDVIDSGDDSVIEWYADRWDSIHGPDAWERNDWVWALTFKRIKP